MQSLTPHEDAARLVHSQFPHTDDPIALAVHAGVGATLLEIAKLMDRGHGSNAAMTVVASVSMSIISSLASSMASNHREEDRASIEREVETRLAGAILHGLQSKNCHQFTGSAVTGASEAGSA
jgi:hypothetical protein